MVGDRGGLFLDSYGLTCGGLELNMTGVYSPGSAECADLQGKYRKSCCDATYTPIPVEQPPTPPPGSSYPQGNEPICDICLDGSFPTKPFSVTAVLYIPGNPKCEDLFWMGRAGTIPGRLCYPLQDYMQVPCGCNGPVFDPDNEEPPTMAPTSAPTSGPIATPTNPPTTTPTILPTSAPTSQPTPAPTTGPTSRPTITPTVRPTESPGTKATLLPPDMTRRGPSGGGKGLDKDDLRLPAGGRTRGGTVRRLKGKS